MFRAQIESKLASEDYACMGWGEVLVIYIAKAIVALAVRVGLPARHGQFYS